MNRLVRWMSNQECPELLVYIPPPEVVANEASQPVSDFHPHRFLFVASLPVPYVLSKIRKKSFFDDPAGSFLLTSFSAIRSFALFLGLGATLTLS